MSGEYQVHLDLFEGPLDLLLYLVQKSEVAIADISVSLITGQYLEYLDVIKDLNIDVASEYLHMAATLIRLKARELLPPIDGSKEDGEEEEGIFNREQLIAQLLEYKKYKEAARTLRTFEAEATGSYARGKTEDIEVPQPDEEEMIGNVSIFDLLTAFKRVLDTTREAEPLHVVELDHVRIDDRIEHLLGMVADHDELPFEQLFAGDNRKLVLVVTFMALLELVKMQEIYFRQELVFGQIFVKRRPAETRDPVV